MEQYYNNNNLLEYVLLIGDYDPDSEISNPVIDSYTIPSYNELQDENSRLIKELTFLESAFKYPHNNSVIFNLVRVKKNGEDTWIDKIKISEFELNKLDQCETVKYLLQNCNPKCER